MNNIKEEFQYKSTCNCGNIRFHFVTKREMVFDLKRDFISNLKCTTCGRRKGYFIETLNSPNIDFDLLEEWSKNDELDFDTYGYEDYIIASSNILTGILKTIDDNKTIFLKKAVLISSLFIMLNDELKSNNRTKILQELKKRKELIETSTNYISSNNKKELLNMIGIKYYEIPYHNNTIPKLEEEFTKNESKLKKWMTDWWNMIK